MGIKHLNRFLVNKCRKTTIQRISLQKLAGKTIVVDTYIYMYMFLGEENLYELMHTMVTTLLTYRITPIFVFDGKPPQEKKELLRERREKKQEAEGKYREIIQQLEAGLDTSATLAMQLSCLKKQFLKIDYEHIQGVKSILRQHQVECVDAPGESDELCVQYVKSHRAWACLSNDMDMFVYGTERVLRDLSLTNHTVNLYHMPSILQDLGMTMTTFRQIMVLSGTDYNLSPQVSLHETMKWYYEYKKYLNTRRQWDKRVTDRGQPAIDFYTWLLKYTKYIQDYPKLMHVYEMFC
jgi:flap endonuclease-1